ncbi:MAG: hypothetical protein IBJ11_07950 [Phycisphaerales bacterium]|nr:hypothetical protein [Phycisphaerales bacterium]
MSKAWVIPICVLAEGGWPAVASTLEEWLVREAQRDVLLLDKPVLIEFTVEAEDNRPEMPLVKGEDPSARRLEPRGPLPAEERQVWLGGPGYWRQNSTKSGSASYWDFAARPDGAWFVSVRPRAQGGAIARVGGHEAIKNGQLGAVQSESDLRVRLGWLTGGGLPLMRDADFKLVSSRLDGASWTATFFSARLNRHAEFGGRWSVTENRGFVEWQFVGERLADGGFKDLAKTSLGGWRRDPVLNTWVAGFVLEMDTAVGTHTRCTWGRARVLEPVELDRVTKPPTENGSDAVRGQVSFTMFERVDGAEIPPSLSGFRGASGSAGGIPRAPRGMSWASTLAWAGLIVGVGALLWSRLRSRAAA